MKCQSIKCVSGSLRFNQHNLWPPKKSVIRLKNGLTGKYVFGLLLIPFRLNAIEFELSSSKKVGFICFNENPLKVVKNAF